MNVKYPSYLPNFIMFIQRFKPKHVYNYFVTYIQYFVQLLAVQFIYLKTSNLISYEVSDLTKDERIFLFMLLSLRQKGSQTIKSTVEDVGGYSILIPFRYVYEMLLVILYSALSIQFAQY
jgi:hypothetical protein